MKRILFFLLTQAAINSYGQSANKQSAANGSSKIEIGVNVSPDICFRTLKNNSGSPITDAIIEQRNKNEISKVGYTAGLNVCFNLKRFFGLETGIHYSNKGYQTDMQNLTYGYFNPPTGNVPAQVNFIYNMYYIDIPVKANFTFGKNKLRFIASAGIATNVFINETQTNVWVYPDKTDKETHKTAFGYKKFNISPMLSLGLDYKINNRMKLRIEPIVRYGMLPIIDAPITGSLYNSGLNIGYYFGL